MNLRLAERPWIYSFVAAFSVGAATLALSGGIGAAQLLQTTLNFAMFFAIVGLGQMLVISSGPGNIDLSMPSVMTLSGLVGMTAMGERSELIVPGVLAALAVGAVVGAINFGLIAYLRVPPIVATLAMSFIIQSVAISVGGAAALKPPAAFNQVVQTSVLGLPVLPLLLMVFTALVALMLRRTILGRSILAVGQNEVAAWLAGINGARTRAFVYVSCAVMASLAGVLLAGFSGGASLDIGSQYQLASVAVVVIGGTSVLGGRAFPQGIWGAAIFLYALVNLLNIAVVKFDLGSTGPGIRLILTGAMIILIIALAHVSDTTKKKPG